MNYSLVYNGRKRLAEPDFPDGLALFADKFRETQIMTLKSISFKFGLRIKKIQKIGNLENDDII